MRQIDGRGGGLPAIEHRYQRAQSQTAAHRYEEQIYNGTRPIIALNKYNDLKDEMPEVKMVRTSKAKKQLQVDRLVKFKKRNAAKSERALDQLSEIVESGKNYFPTLIETVEVCSLGQITERLQEVVGRFRPMV